VTISVASIPKELELKDTTDPVSSTSYLDLLFEMTYYLSSMTNMMTFYSFKAKSKTHESRDKDEAMKTETNTTRSTYEIKENTHKTKSK
jgi:hypothetical protein